VIFAGAGVSKPSGLPLFPKLVKEITNKEVSEAEEGQLDRVLGRARDQGLSVHKLAAECLKRCEARFNSLHKNLVVLSGSFSTLRIVTTNFDSCFEDAISNQQGVEGVDIYTAPALPIGSSFSGLVHLHGSLAQQPEEMVLTDADFGRAYLSEGWAGRFVVELFREFTVLFVGYSYGDTVMGYLTRGLAPSLGKKRFALTPLGEREKWQLLGIEPIEYDPADKHRALADGLRRWVTLERRGFLEWSRRLKDLVTRRPEMLAPDEKGELDFCLKHPKRINLFYKYARDSEWLRWAEERGLLDPLFSAHTDQEGLREIADWFAEDPLDERGEMALQIALGRFRMAGAVLADSVCRQVQGALSRLKIVQEVHARRAAAWAVLLIERTPLVASRPTMGLLGWIVHLSPSKHSDLIVQILAHQMRSVLIFRDYRIFRAEEDLGISLETQIFSDEFSLYRDWLSDNISEMARMLVPVLTESLETRFRWWASLENSDPSLDPWAWQRPWVEQPPGDTSSYDAEEMRGPGLVLGIGKKILDALLENEPKEAVAVIELWLSANAPQLRQLGLYGLAKSRSFRPAKKVKKLLSCYLPATEPFKVEAFRVLRSAYPMLTYNQRKTFLKKAGRLYRQKIDKHQDPRWCREISYGWFNFLVWLERSAPSDPLLESALSEVRESYPDFEPLEHPELDPTRRAVAGLPRAECTLKSEKIERLSPAEWVEELDALRNQQRGVVEEEQFKECLRETAITASENLEWGLSLMGHLRKNELYGHAVWKSVLSAWRKRDFEPSEWERVLRVVDQPRILEGHASHVIEILVRLVEQKEPEATEPMLRSALLLAERLLPLTEDVSYGESPNNRDWFSQALNHPGGDLARFVTGVVGTLVGRRPSPACGMPPQTQRLLEMIVDGEGMGPAMGRVMLAAHAHYFFWIDPGWTRDKLLPLFDWNRDEGQAEQVWQSFFLYGRPFSALSEALEGAIVELSSHLGRFGDQRKHYGEFIARAAFALPDDPFTKPWFQGFLCETDDADRASFAWTLAENLESLQPEQKEEVWEAWLERYFKRRTEYPPDCDGEEFTALVAWAFKLPSRLREIVEYLERLPGRGAVEHMRLFFEFERGEVADKDPDGLSRLFQAYLERREEIKLWDQRRIQSLIKHLIEIGASEPLARKLTEVYIEKGGQNHEELEELLRGRQGRGA